MIAAGWRSPAAPRMRKDRFTLSPDSLTRRERQIEGIKAAKARGIYKGRKPTIDPVELRRLRDEEKLGPAAIARRLGVGRASVYRVLGNA